MTTLAERRVYTQRNTDRVARAIGRLEWAYFDEGEPDEKPIATFWAGRRRCEDTYSLVWMYGGRVVCENFRPTQGKEGEEWGRQLYDYDPVSKRLGISFWSDRGEAKDLHWYELDKDISTSSNIPAVYLAHLAETLETIVDDKSTEILEFPER